jgi:hypothetical protein
MEWHPGQRKRTSHRAARLYVMSRMMSCMQMGAPNVALGPSTRMKLCFRFVHQNPAAPCTGQHGRARSAGLRCFRFSPRQAATGSSLMASPGKLRLTPGPCFCTAAQSYARPASSSDAK